MKSSGIGSKARDIFNSIAERYDTEQQIRIAGIAAREMKKFITDSNGRDALDYGCGTGLIGLEMTDMFRSVLLVDSASNMIRIVKEKIADRKITNAVALCSDMLKQSANDKKVDYIFMSQVLLHIGDVDQVLRRMYELLNPNGHLLIVDFDKNEQVNSDQVHNGFDQQELKEYLLKIGFDDIESYNFYEGENIFMKQDAVLFILNAIKLK